MMPITASAMTTGAAHCEASGNSGRQNRSMPKVPTLSSTPTSSTAPPGGDSAAASGSQVWNGHSGALIAKAMKKPRNSMRSVLVPISVPSRFSNRNACGPPSERRRGR